MEPLAQPSDIVAIWQPLTTAQAVLAPGLIAQASLKLRLLARRRGVDLDALMLDELTKAAVTNAVASAVKRVLMNPEAVRQMSITTGPMSESRTLDTAISSGLLYLDDDDLADIFPIVKRSRMRSFTIRPGMR